MISVSFWCDKCLFQDLKYGLQKLTTVALKPENKSKNKYKDMYACKY